MAESLHSLGARRRCPELPLWDKEGKERDTSLEGNHSLALVLYYIGLTAFERALSLPSRQWDLAMVTYGWLTHAICILGGISTPPVVD